MPDVIICDPSLDEDWDCFVTRHPYGWVCHLSVWKEILQESFKHMKPCYLCLRQNPNGRIKAALPLYRVNSWITGNRLVSLPFATLCDPLVSSKDEFIMLFDAARKLKERAGCRYFEIRVFQTGRWVDNCHMSAYNNYKHHYLPLNKSPQELMKSFHRTTVRQRIGKAKKKRPEYLRSKRKYCY